MTNPSKSIHFLRKVRNQVLKNREIEHFLKYYAFDEMKYSNYTFLNEFYTARCKIIEEAAKDNFNLNLDFFGPIDYSWKKDVKCCLFVDSDRDYPETIFVLPCDWLRKYDPNMRIFGYNVPCYLDIEKTKLQLSGNILDKR